jgi:ribosomal protein S17E
MKQNYRIHLEENEKAIQTAIQDTSSEDRNRITGYIKRRMKQNYRIHLGENETAIQDTSSGE